MESPIHNISEIYYLDTFLFFIPFILGNVSPEA